MRRLTTIDNCLAALPAAAAPARVNVNREIRPILSEKCFFCHGPDATERKADLRMKDRSES